MATTLGDVEIVSLDSMQVYRGMDIGTAKPALADRASVPHHGIDVADPDELWSVVRTQSMARAALADIESRGRRALFVGGTGLYVQAVVDDLTVPAEDLELRAQLEAWTSEPGGMLAAYRELCERDPIAASRIDEHNQRRVVRALEVIRLTSRPFSSFGSGLDRYGPPAFDVRLVGVWWEREALARRIEERIAAMKRAGFVQEARELVARPAGLARTAARAIGYSELFAGLAAGGTENDLEEAFALTIRRTRSFARRQRMWFRRDPRICWMSAPRNIRALIPALLALWGAVSIRSTVEATS